MNSELLSVSKLIWNILVQCYYVGELCFLSSLLAKMQHFYHVTKIANSFIGRFNKRKHMQLAIRKMLLLFLCFCIFTLFIVLVFNKLTKAVFGYVVVYILLVVCYSCCLHFFLFLFSRSRFLGYTKFEACSLLTKPQFNKWFLTESVWTRSWKIFNKQGALAMVRYQKNIIITKFLYCLPRKEPQNINQQRLTTTTTTTWYIVDHVYSVNWVLFIKQCWKFFCRSWESKP
jgi:hypothetical protein